MNLISIAGWVAGLLGFSLLVTGIALISVPAGMIAAGVLLLVWAFLADRAAARLALATPAKE
ncbi:hypothetical protein YK56LOC_62230 [Caballeronia sp. HLA56]